MKHVVFMTFVGLFILAYMKVEPMVLIGWASGTICLGLAIGLLYE